LVARSFVLWLRHDILESYITSAVAISRAISSKIHPTCKTLYFRYDGLRCGVPLIPHLTSESAEFLNWALSHDFPFIFSERPTSCAMKVEHLRELPDVRRILFCNEDEIY
jgi:hypothetical protein